MSWFGVVLLTRCYIHGGSDDHGSSDLSRFIFVVIKLLLLTSVSLLLKTKFLMR